MATKPYYLQTIGDETLDAIHAKLDEVRQIVSPSDYEFIQQRLIDELFAKSTAKRSDNTR